MLQRWDIVIEWCIFCLKLMAFFQDDASYIRKYLEYIVSHIYKLLKKTTFFFF